MKRHIPERVIGATIPESEERAEELAHKINTLYLCDGEKNDCDKTFCSFIGNGSCRHTSDIKHAKNKGKRNYERRENGNGTTFIEIENDA